jgi:16S rRNA (uracil1498-N3)-methyltransferase
VNGPRIHTDQELGEHQSLQLDAAASGHLAGALRLRAGDHLTLFNGSGGEYRATISHIERKQVTVEIDAFRERCVESPLNIHLGIAISRGERMDWVIQKTTELGVKTISTLFSERCEVKLKGERAEKKLRHWRQVAISACEQCGRNDVPAIVAPQQLGNWCESVDADARLVLHHQAETWREPRVKPASVALLIGPEGGLTVAEITNAQERGFVPAALGPRVLRTETAPLAACAILQARWGDMG